MPCTQQRTIPNREVIDVDTSNQASSVTPTPKKTNGRKRKRIADAVSLLVPPPPKSKKPKDSLLHSCFVETDTTIAGKPKDYIDVSCKYCDAFVRKGIKTFNSTRGRTHSVFECDGIPADLKEKLSKTSQAAKKERKSAVVSLGASNSLSSIRSTINLLAESSASSPKTRTRDTDNNSAIVSSKKKPRVHVQAAINGTNSGFGPGIKRADAQRIIKAEVKAALSRRESLVRFKDPYVRAALSERCPGIEKFLPTDENTLYDNYALDIDRECLDELMGYIKKLPGLINVGMDGATFNGKQKVSNLLAVSYSPIHCCLHTLLVYFN